MKAIIVFGANDVSQLARFYFEQDQKREVAAFCVNRKYLQQASGQNIPIIALEDVMDFLGPEKAEFFVPIYDNKLREKKANEISNMGYNLVSYVSSAATVWSPVGRNCFIMEDNTVQPFVHIGDNVIMWSGNHIGHHSVIKSNVFFSSHVVLSGHCIVEPYCWLGVNSTIRDHIILAEGTFVAMSAAITKNTRPYKKYMGAPAREYGSVD